MRLDLNRHIGTELRGLQLPALADDGIAELHRLVAVRGVLVLRAQRMDLDDQITIGRRLGALHVHPLHAGSERPEALPIHTHARSSHASGDRWHSDLSWNQPPAALSILRLDVVPTVGGDTAFASTYAAFDTLSEPMKAFVLGLHAVHASSDASARDLPPAEHPVVRTHPITGRRSLFVNSAYTERIRQLTRSESEAMLAFLFAHIAFGVSFQCRVRWESGTVVIWDNRCTQHCASWDYRPETRSGWRVTTVAERPYLDVSQSPTD